MLTAVARWRESQTQRCGLALPITHKMRHVSWLGAGRSHRAVQFVAGTHANEFREPLP